MRKNYKLKNMRITVIFIDDRFLKVYNFKRRLQIKYPSFDSVTD